MKVVYKLTATNGSLKARQNIFLHLFPFLYIPKIPKKAVVGIYLDLYRRLRECHYCCDSNIFWLFDDWFDNQDLTCDI